MAQARIKELAEKIASYLMLDGEYMDFDSALIELERLHGRGRMLFDQLLTGQEMEDGNFAEVVGALGRALLGDPIQRELPLLKLLIRTFCFFVELFWYECVLADLTARSHTTAVENIIQKVNKQFVPFLPEKRSIEEQLQLRCAGEIGKILLMCSSLCEGWVRSLADLYSNQNKIQSWRQLMKQAKYIEYSGGEWYFDVHNMQMLSICVKQLEDFDTCMNDKIVQFCQAGGKKTVGLVIAFKNIIMDDQKDYDLRNRAFHGIGSNHGLKDLLGLEFDGTFARISKLVRKDKFYKTRRLVSGFLAEILKSSGGPTEVFKSATLQLVQARFQLLAANLERGGRSRAELERSRDELQQALGGNPERLPTLTNFLASARAGDLGEDEEASTENLMISDEAKYVITMRMLQGHDELRDLEEILQEANMHTQ